MFWGVGVVFRVQVLGVLLRCQMPATVNLDVRGGSKIKKISHSLLRTRSPAEFHFCPLAQRSTKVPVQLKELPWNHTLQLWGTSIHEALMTSYV